MIISATEFKAKCLELLDRVSRTGESIQVTKRGKIVAELKRPYGAEHKHSGPGFAQGEMFILGDIMDPIDVKWEAMEDGG